MMNFAQNQNHIRSLLAEVFSGAVFGPRTQRLRLRPPRSVGDGIVERRRLISDAYIVGRAQ